MRVFLVRLHIKEVLSGSTTCREPPMPPAAAGEYPGVATVFPEKFRISFSTSRIKSRDPPAGEKTTVNLGHAHIPQQHVRSGLPADRGQSQKGVDGTVVIMHTPSVGCERNPRCGFREMTVQGLLRATLRMEIILSKGTSISILPIQNRKPPSAVMSTLLTKLYQYQPTPKRFPIDTETTVPCAPIGTAMTRSSTKMASNIMKRSLKPTTALDKS